MEKQQISILGATGSIGISTLEVIAAHSERYAVTVLTANTNYSALIEQSKIFHPSHIVLTDQKAGELCQQKHADYLSSPEAPKLLIGSQALVDVVEQADCQIVMAAIVGAAGLEATLAYANAGKRILLANKESLVMSGDLLLKSAKTAKAAILPIDSEHNAVFQCLPISMELDTVCQKARPFLADTEKSSIKRVILTASGGPFLNRDKDTFSTISPDEACDHPKWDMGRKISVDSATLMNKGLEVIEACLLFDLPPEQVDVVIHPQSIVHSMVEYVDGSVIAQMANPDMKIPIAYGLAWPERIDSGVSSLDLISNEALEFRSPDCVKFPCLDLAYKAIRKGSSFITVLNAANEEAVSAFLSEEIAFTQISEVIDHCLETLPAAEVSELTDVLSVDKETRECAQAYLVNLRKNK